MDPFMYTLGDIVPESTGQGGQLVEIVLPMGLQSSFQLLQSFPNSFIGVPGLSLMVGSEYLLLY